MQNKFVVTPYFLDEPVWPLLDLADDDYLINQPLLMGEDTQSRMSSLHRPLSEFVSHTVLVGIRPVSISGDCCSSIGVLAGLQKAGVDASLIWFDAHGDFNTPQTSPSGFLGGMPLAMLVGRGDQIMPAAVGLRPLAEEKVILTDGRDLDSGERILVEQSRITHLANSEQLLDYSLPEGPLYVHFDVDILNADEASAHNYPVKGGSSSSVIRSVYQRLAATGRVVAASLSSWNPKLDRDGNTRRLSMDVFEALLVDEVCLLRLADTGL
ncbi:MAG TPA: arginase family protein [Gammaproteobacteria bacterium]|nr:arginase family protein [Gammaproteobacteria bacterium]